MATSHRPDLPPRYEASLASPVTLVCIGCATPVQFDRAAGTAEAADGSRGLVMYADDALIVWACPSCEYPQAEDLTT